MSWLRLLVIGGLTSYRAFFTWLSPWIFIPILVLAPIFQILLFVFVGRVAGIGDDRFFLIGNAIQYAAIPCLFAMIVTINNERVQGTLPLLLASPARRIPLFLGRALPIILNGFVVSVVALVFGAVLLRVQLAPPSLLPMAAVVAVCAFSCTGLGLATAAVGLRVREVNVLGNVIFGVLLIFAGVNIPLDLLPGWMGAVGQWMPLTHGIAATRQVAGGSGLTEVTSEMGKEAGLGVFYVAAGLCLLWWFERQSRQRAALELR